jgi:hypothetical protein
VFTIRRIQRSQSTGMGVHDRPDSVFTIHRIAHIIAKLERFEKFGDDRNQREGRVSGRLAARRLSMA